MNLDSWRLALLFAVGLSAALGVVGLMLIRRTERKTGFSLTAAASSVNVVGSDTGAAPAMLVREPTLGLRGRPDYVLEYGAPNERRLYPLEVKPTRRGQRVYESDELQVGAYLIALRGTAGARAASTGYVRYAAGTFRIDLSPDLERRVRETVALIRRGRRAAVVHRSHTIRARCAGCPVRDHCDERLV
jgi:CRISPR/Cas system-associated exonuclease Cas4 (RecB family)